MAVSREQYVALLEQMIETPGWSLVQEEAEKEIYHIQANALEAKDWGEVQKMRGKAEQLAELIALPEIVAAQRQELDEMIGGEDASL
jgi:hypothetical protein